MSYPYAYVVCYVRCARIPHLERYNTGFYVCENAVFLAYNLLPQKPLPMQKMYPVNLLLSLKAQQYVSLGGVSPRGLNRSFVFQRSKLHVIRSLITFKYCEDFRGSLLRQREVVNFKFQVRWWKGRCDNRHVSSGAQKEKKGVSSLRSPKHRAGAYTS